MIRVIVGDSRSSDKKRILALDILRGLAILGMALSSMLPWGHELPGWMYHAQNQPPDLALDMSKSGLTWVDVVFPFFIFAMGAAIPIALGRRVRDDSAWSVAGGILKRGALLAVFAFVSQHFRLWSFTNEPQPGDWWLALGFFFATVMAFARWPEGWNRFLRWGLTLAGVLTLLAGFLWMPSEGAVYFDRERVDIILLILANVWVSGAFVWWATHRNPVGRIAVMGLVAALILVKDLNGVGGLVYSWTPVPWLYQFDYHAFLLVVIPGTICGEWLLRHRSFEEPEGHPPYAGWFLGVCGIALTGVVCWGLFGREVDLTLFLALVLMLAMGAVLKLSCGSSRWQLRMGQWGFWLVLVGVLLDPMEGGIKKVPANFSYFFTTAGLAFWMVVAWLEITKGAIGQKSWGWLAAVGANPLLGYVAITNLVPPLLQMTGVSGVVGGMELGTAGLMAFSFVQVGLVALVCVVATRTRFFLRV